MCIDKDPEKTKNRKQSSSKLSKFAKNQFSQISNFVPRTKKIKEERGLTKY